MARPDVCWRLHPRRQPRPLRCLGLEDYARNQDPPSPITRYPNQIIQESRQGAYGSAGEVDGDLAEDFLAGVEG